MTQLYQIRLENTSKYFAVAAANVMPIKGDHVAIRRDFFLDAGRIIGVTEGDVASITDTRKTGDVPSVVRVMTEADHAAAAESRIRAEKALPVIRQFIIDLQLGMKILNVIYSLDQKLCTIQFASENRVDFRELLKLLSTSLNSRIELRQVSVRDESAAVGGLGCCGQELCCSRFLNEFASINVKMAKDQDISLSSSNISGVCGRLKCCLKFEHETYLELQSDMPRRGDVCECKAGCGRVTDRNLLSRRVTINVDEGNGNFRYVHCNRDDEDLQVISGKGKPVQSNDNHSKES